MKKYISIITIVFMSISFATNAQWVTLNVNTSLNLELADFPNDSVGYLLTDNYYAFKTKDGGRTWSNGNLTSYNVLFFLSADTGFGAGVNGGIYKTVDGDSTWTTVLSTTDYILSFSFPGNGNIGYASGVNTYHDTSAIYKTLDRGNTWNKIPSVQVDTIGPGLVYFTDTITGYWVDEQSGGILYTNDGGISWNSSHYTLVTNGFVISLYFLAKDTGYAVGGNGMILKTTDGQNWVQQSQSATEDPLYSVFFTSTQHGFAVGGNGYSSGEIIETVDGGQTWTLDVLNGNTFQSVYFPSSNVGYACGLNGELMKYGQTAGIQELTDQTKISLYPNPSSSGKFHISMSANDGGAKDIFVYDMFGNDVYDNLKTTQSDLDIDLSKNAKGVYLVKVVSEGKVSVSRVVLM